MRSPCLNLSLTRGTGRSTWAILIDKYFHHISFTKYIFPLFSKMIALHQNVANCQNTLICLITVHTFCSKWYVYILPSLVKCTKSKNRFLGKLCQKVCIIRDLRPTSLGDQMKEGNILFNDALNTFNVRLYRVRHMVTDHSDSEMGNPLPQIDYCRLAARAILYASSHRPDNTYHGLCSPAGSCWSNAAEY